MAESESPSVPLIGLMVTVEDEVDLNKRRDLFRDVAADARQAGVAVILFNWHGVDFDNRQVRGWISHGDGWVAAEQPLPEAIHNVATHADREQSAQARSVCNRLADEFGIPFVNRLPSFSKWKVYTVLQASEETRHLHPETMKFRDLKSLRNMVQRHGMIYIKDQFGSRGRSVMRIRPRSGGWRLEGLCRTKPIDKRFGSLEELHLFLQELDLNYWILQQGIAGPRVEGRTFDLRVVVQRNGHGNWEAAMSYVRWATNNQVANNIFQGARQLHLTDFAAQFGPQVLGLPEFQKNAYEASLQVAKVLGEHFDTLGEIGVDIGLDQGGRVWVFEVNPIPRRKVGFSMHRRIFEYGRFLASQKSSQTTETRSRTKDRTKALD